MNIELGIIDTMWDVSIYPEQGYITLLATIPPAIHLGWYRVRIAWDGTILQEKRMLASGNYDPYPETNRPPIRLIIQALSEEQEQIRQVRKNAYQID